MRVMFEFHGSDFGAGVSAGDGWMCWEKRNGRDERCGSTAENFDQFWVGRAGNRINGNWGRAVEISRGLGDTGGFGAGRSFMMWIIRCWNSVVTYTSLGE